MNILNMVYTLRFFLPFSKCSLFHNSNVFGSCFIHILYTECAKIKKNPAPQGYGRMLGYSVHVDLVRHGKRVSVCVVSLRIKYFGRENLRGWNRQSKLSPYFFFSLRGAIVVNYISLIPLSY